MNKKKLILYAVATVMVASVFLKAVFSPTYASVLENGTRVEPESELKYYIHVTSSGKDKNANASDTKTVDVYSKEIYVEDKLPDGLTFVGFEETSDGTIGSAPEEGITGTCGGYVVGGVSGLKYDTTTRTVSFVVKNLKAGCKLSVGVITRTPTVDDPATDTVETRRDFYNTAHASTRKSSLFSNVVHTYIGKDDATLYNVSYQYTGEVPEGAPEVIGVTQYAADTMVGVAQSPILSGYVFSGWTSDDVSVADGKFKMPNKNVILKGSFSKQQEYAVTYQIIGDAPSSYIAPKAKNYYVNDYVTVDSLSKGDIIDGYRFLGWTSDDVTITDGTFKMGNKNVVLKGSFEKVTYKVTYKFQGSVLPPNADDLLPAVKSYLPGDTVTLETISSVSGYKFLGWYKSDSFVMPNEDVTIYGEWMEEAGLFSPSIKKEIDGPKKYYSKGDVIRFKITVTNHASFPITDVLLEESLAGASFINFNPPTSDTEYESGAYTVLNNSHVKIHKIVANSSAVIDAEYTVGDDVSKIFTNTVSITGALADNHYHLDTSKEYKATVDFKVANIALSINKLDEENNPLLGSEFTLYSDQGLTNEVGTGLKFTGLVPESVYYLVESKVPTGYVKVKGPLVVTVHSDGSISIPNYEISGDAGDYHVDIINQKIDILPETGGIGIVPFIVIGSIVIIGSGVGYVMYLKKGRVKKNGKDKK